ALEECIRLAPLIVVVNPHAEGQQASATAKWSRQLLSRKCDLTCVSSTEELEGDHERSREDATLLIVYPRNDAEAVK
ncbi:hypothetical protein Pmar_PMAR003146, partial [Perkinsus marinus ATCC 50983]